MAFQHRPPVVPEEFQFNDFDDPAVFEETKLKAADETCKNFVIEFGPQCARIARDLEKEEFAYLFRHDRRGDDHPIRWINIWDTSAQKEVVSIIGKKYAFSQRLVALMANATEFNNKAVKPGADKKSSATAAKSGSSSIAPKNVSSSQVDIERDSAAETEKKAAEKMASEKSRGLRLEGEEVELYFLLKDTVNFTSIDQTDNALCIGAHWLYKRPDVTAQQNEAGRKLMPPKHWLWLALCDDNTVVSFHEYPTLEQAPKGMDADIWRKEHIQNMRYNMLNVLLQQSIQGSQLYEQKPLSQNSIRLALKESLERSDPTGPELSRMHSGLPVLDRSHSRAIGEEGTSNLFYYLFEDYTAAGPLKAADKILEEITPKVLQSANRRSKIKSSEIIPKLHNLSKELRMLKHLFENYKILIDKIMIMAKEPDNYARNMRNSMVSRSNTNLTDPMGHGDENRVCLTHSAMNRFDRLRNRLEGLMLNTIEGHFEEISALSDTYFNLTQQKDSQATARLTRSATLLAKLSVFFLPISFMTSYFSIQIEDLYQWWTGETYWYSFAVIATLSFLSLFFFGRTLMFFSDVLDEWVAWVSIWFQKFLRYLGFKIASEDDEG